MGNSTLSYLQYVILCGGIIWSCVSFANQMKGNVTFGNVFGHGFKTTAIVAALILIYTFIAVKFLFPDMVDQAIAMTKTKMESQKNLSDEQIQQSLDMVKNNFLVFAVIGIVVGFAIIGAVSSLIGAALAKKNPKDPFARTTQL